MPRIELINVTKRWGNFVGVDHLNMVIEDREFITLLGPSGCGKTTTLRTISGIIKASSGKVLLNGKNITNHKAYNIASMGVTQSPEGRLVFIGLTVEDNLKAGAYSLKTIKKEENGKIVRISAKKQLKDNLERAIMMDDNDLSDEVSKFLSGFKLILGNLTQLFDKYEVKEVDCLGLEFDPNVAEAVLTEHDETKPENVVLEVLTKGYKYKDKLIRPAMVKVNK